MVLIDGQAGVSSGAPSRPYTAPAVQDQAYGLAVWGSDMVAYVDPAFQIRDGMAPVDIVLEERGLSGRLKVVAGGLLGDVNGDGRVDIVDALFVAMYSVDPSTLAAHIPNISLGDVDADGDLDFTDAYLIGTYSVNPLDPTLPAGIGQAVSDPDSLTPEDARSALNDRGIAYTPASFLDRVRAGDVSAVRLFIAAGMDIHVPDDNGTTVLMEAVWYGQIEMVRFLLANGVDLHVRRDNGQTALILAARAGHVEVVRILVEQWVAEAGTKTQDDYGTTVLMWSAFGGDVEMVRFLLDNGADLHARDDNGRTALMWAARGGHVEVVRFMLDNGADLHTLNNTGRTVLMWAAFGGDVEVVRFYARQWCRPPRPR